MKITILGTGAATPGPGEACSGFLVEEDNIKLLVDCGNGVLSKLQEHHELTSVSDIIVTHMHADHFLDLIPYRYALRYGIETVDVKPRLHLPPGGSEALQTVVSPFAETDFFFSEVFEVSEYMPDRQLKLGNIELQMIPVKHYIPSYGLTITNTHKVAYSADSGLCPGLQRIADNAVLFICNTALCLNNEKMVTWGHITPEQGGNIAREAGVKHLLLSHLWPTCNYPESLARATETFGGTVELAKSHNSYEY